MGFGSGVFLSIIHVSGLVRTQTFEWAAKEVDVVSDESFRYKTAWDLRQIIIDSA